MVRMTWSSFSFFKKKMYAVCVVSCLLGSRLAVLFVKERLAKIVDIWHNAAFFTLHHLTRRSCPPLPLSVPRGHMLQSYPLLLVHLAVRNWRKRSSVSQCCLKRHFPSIVAEPKLSELDRRMCYSVLLKPTQQMILQNQH